MRLTFLGTGTSQGIPVIGCECVVCKSSDDRDKRLRCAAFLQDGDTQLLFDSGPDIRYQLLRAGVSRLDGVLLTHEHYDHTGGLDDLRPIIFIQKTPLKIYTQSDVKKTLRVKYDYAFGIQKYPGAPRFELEEIGQGEKFEINKMQVQPLKVFHGDLGILGFKINNKLIYITDASSLPKETIDYAYGIPCLVINALHHRPHHSHYTLEETLNVIDQINPESAYIIHMSHHMGLHTLMQATLPPNVFFAYDTLSIDM